MIVVMPNVRRTGPTYRIAGCKRGANIKTIPTSSRISPILLGLRSISTPSASSTSALPLREVNDLFPCLAIGIPAPAATNAAAVEMLNVVTVPPPVPAVSTNLSGSDEMINI